MQLTDPFNPYDGSSSYPEIDPIPASAQMNPYAQDTNSATGGAAYFQQQNSFAPLVVLPDLVKPTVKRLTISES